MTTSSGPGTRATGPPARGAGGSPPGSRCSTGCASALPDARLRLLAAHPLRDPGPGPARGCRRGWRCGPTSSSASVPGRRPRRPVRAGRGARRPAGDPSGRCRAGHRGARPRGPGRSAGRGGRPTAGELDADVVVCAVDPRRLPALAAYVARTIPVAAALDHPPRPRRRSRADLSDPAPEIVLHGDARPGRCTPVVVPPAGGAAWTVHGRPRADLLDDLAERGVDLRDRVVARRRRTPRRDVEERSAGSPLGVRWRGRSTVRRRLGPAHADPTGSTPRARTPPRAPGCRSSGCPPPWSPRWSAPPDTARVRRSAPGHGDRRWPRARSPGSKDISRPRPWPSRRGPRRGWAEPPPSTTATTSPRVAPPSPARCSARTRASANAASRARPPGPGRGRRPPARPPSTRSRSPDLRARARRAAGRPRSRSATPIAQRVPGLEAGRPALVVVGRPDAEVGGGDPVSRR